MTAPPKTVEAPGDLPTLMAMARKVYTHTFAKTDDVEAAAQLAAKELVALGKDGRPTRQGALAGRNLPAWLWSGRWASCAFPLVVPGEPIAKRFLQRPAAVAERVAAMPATLWPAFLIELPRGFLAMHNGERALSIDFVSVMFDEGARWLGTVSRDTSLGWTSVVTPSGFSHASLSDDEQRVLGWLWRCVLGIVEALDDEARYVAPLGVVEGDPSQAAAPRRYTLR